MSDSATRGALMELSRPLRARDRLAWSAAAAGAVLIVLGTAGWAARLGWVASPVWVLVAWTAAAAAALVLLLYARARAGELHFGALARHLEARGGWRRGALTSLLERSADGTSPGLLAAADRSQADEVARRGPSAIDALARSVRMAGYLGVASLALGAVVFATAGPASGSAAALWRPGRAWAAITAPVSMRVDRPVVNRGERVALTVQALGQRTATLWVRRPGESWLPRTVRLDSLGQANVTSEPLETDLFVRVTSGRRASDTVAVRVRIPAFVSALQVTARYPRYLGLEDEPVPTTGDTILVPMGTRLETRGTATAALRSVAWRGADVGYELAVDRSSFSGAFVPTRGGEYRLAIGTEDGAPLAGDVARLTLRVVADSAPVVEVPVPGVDTLAPVDLRVPLVIDVRDDYAITAVAVESRRVSRLGLRDSAVTEPIALPGGAGERAILTFTLDLARRNLVPGDTIRYRARATDNAPGGQTGWSRELVLRIPTLTELREAQRQATSSVASRLDSATAESRTLERRTEDLAREQPRAGARDGRRSLSYEEAKRAEAVAKSQEQMMQEAEELARTMEELRQSSEAAGLRDSAWQRQLQEIQEQIEKAISPELRERLAALQEALKNLDAEQTREALDRLAEAQREMREALERSRELFERAAMEGELANLGQEATDLAREQREWSENLKDADSAAAAAAERELAARADSLAAALERLAKETKGERGERMKAAGEQAETAANEMQQAAQQASGGDSESARRSGRQAAQRLQPLGEQLSRERQGMQQEWKQEVIEAIDRALSETSRIAERELKLESALRQGTSPGQEMRAEQGAVEEGVQRLLDQVKELSGKNALVSQQIGGALASAQLQMKGARDALSAAVPNSRDAADRAGAAVDALNAAAYQLVRTRGDVMTSGSGSGLNEALERMAQLAQQQGAMGQQAGGLMPMAGSSGVQEQLRRLGARQRALGEELRRMQAGGEIPGAGEMADEAKDLARRLESGRLDRQTVERQERLFRRMLDAGRTLQGQEEDEQKERQSTAARGDSVRLPPALRAKLGEDADGVRVPSWEVLQALSPEERRLVVDYFRRLTAGPR